MKNLSSLVWLTQVGISVVSPLAGFVLCALWLRDQFGLGKWVICAGLVLGIVCAVSGFRQCLLLMEQNTTRGQKKEAPPPGFNEHI